MDNRRWWNQTPRTFSSAPEVSVAGQSLEPALDGPVGRANGVSNFLDSAVAVECRLCFGGSEGHLERQVPDWDFELVSAANRLQERLTGLHGASTAQMKAARTSARVRLSP